MSFTRISFGIVTRSNGGSAKRRTAYQRCSNDSGFDFSSKADELVDHDVILPDGADPKFSDPQTLWDAAEAAEKRKDAQVCRTIEIAIPREVPAEDRRDLAEAILREHFVSRGFAVEWSIHNPPALFEDDEQPHIHAAVTLRHIQGDQLAAKKDREFNSIMTKKAPGSDKKATFMRTAVADTMNRFFNDRMIKAHVDPNPKDLPTIPQAPKSILRQFERWKKQADQAIKNGEKHVPTQPEKLREFIEAREQAVTSIRELENLERQISACEKEATAHNSVHEEKPFKATERSKGRKPSGQRDVRQSDTIDDRATRSHGQSSKRNARDRSDARSPRTTGTRTSEHTRTDRQSRRDGLPTVRDIQGRRANVSSNRQTKAAKGCKHTVDYAASMTAQPASFPTLDGTDADAAARFLRQWSANYQAPGFS